MLEWTSFSNTCPHRIIVFFVLLLSSAAWFCNPSLHVSHPVAPAPSLTPTPLCTPRPPPLHITKVSRLPAPRPPRPAHLWLCPWQPAPQRASRCSWPSLPPRRGEGPQWWRQAARPTGPEKGQGPMAARQAVMWSRGVTCWAAAAAAAAAAGRQLATVRTTHTPPAPLRPLWVLQRARRVACRRQTRRYAEAPSAGISSRSVLIHTTPPFGGAHWWRHSLSFVKVENTSEQFGD